MSDESQRNVPNCKQTRVKQYKLAVRCSRGCTLQPAANKTQLKRHNNEFNRMLHHTLLVVSFSQRAQPASCRTTQMDSFSSGLFQPTNSAGCNEFSRLFQPASSTVCRVTKIDSFSSRLCQTPNSSGCFNQRVQPVVSANEIKRSA